MFMIFLYLLAGAAIGLAGLFLLVGVDYNFTNPNNKALRDFNKNPNDWKDIQYDGFLHKSGLLLLDANRIKTFTEKQTSVDPYNNSPPGVVISHSDSQQKRYQSIIKSRQDKLARQRVKIALEGEKAAVEEKKKDEKLGFFEARKVKSLGTF